MRDELMTCKSYRTISCKLLQGYIWWIMSITLFTGHATQEELAKVSRNNYRRIHQVLYTATRLIELLRQGRWRSFVTNSVCISPVWCFAIQSFCQKSESCLHGLFSYWCLSFSWVLCFVFDGDKHWFLWKRHWSAPSCYAQWGHLSLCSVQPRSWPNWWLQV